MPGIRNITLDCVAPEQLAPFWAAATGYTVAETFPYFARLVPNESGLPQMLLIQVPEPRTSKNRMHIDLGADDREAEVQRLIGLGATQGETHSIAGLT